MRGPAYILFLALFALGIAVSPSSGGVFLAVALSSVILSCTITFIVLRGRARFLLMLVAFMALGMMASHLASAAARYGILPGLSRDHVVAEVSGRVVSPPLENDRGITFFFAVSQVSARGRTWKTGERLLARMDSPEEPDYVFPGSNLKMRGKMETPGYDSRWLMDHGACSIINTSADELIRARTPPDPVSKTVSRVREWVSGVYGRRFPPNVAGLIEGVTLSKTGNMDPGSLADLRGCGLSHIVAVSGLHVGSAAVLALAILSALGAGKKARYLGAITMAIVVLGLANFRPSATRAAIMAGVCFSGSIAGRDYDSLVGLSLAGFFILAINPRAVWDPGFQYSFSAALGIVVAARLRRKNQARLRMTLIFCSAAQLGILPLVLMRGEGVPVTAIAANLIVVPLVGPLLFSSWATALVSAVSGHIGMVAALVPAGIARFILRLASTLSRVPKAGLSGGTVATVSLLVYAVGLITLIARARDGRPLLRPLALLLLASLLLFAPRFPLPVFNAPERFVALDVGQGDAMLIQDGSGGTVLVDGGPDENKIMQKMRERGVWRLDLVVLSHPHDDHARGLVEVLREIPVGRLVEPGLGKDATGAYRELLQTAEARKIPRTIAREGQMFLLSKSMQLEVLYAPRDLTDIPQNLNDCSIVIMAKLDGAKALMTGDIEIDAQKVLEELHPDLSCSVLKVPHQGARDAADPGLVEACRPALALISVKRGNSYGHPSAACLRILRDRGVCVLRTDQFGDIEVSVGNGRIGVNTENGFKMAVAAGAGR